MLRYSLLTLLLSTSCVFAQNWQPAEQQAQSAYEEKPRGLFGVLFSQSKKQQPSPQQGVVYQPPTYTYFPAEQRNVPEPRQRQASLSPMQSNAPHYGFDEKYTPQTVSYSSGHGVGTVVIESDAKFLYLITGQGQARRYGIGVGREGFQWRGVKNITRKAEWPDWRPPPEMRKRRPDLPAFMEGGITNPLGARAMYLGSSMYRIHGTNEPHTIGHNVSSGCFRMRNEDVEDLYTRVRVGTRVVVI